MIIILMIPDTTLLFEKEGSPQNGSDSHQVDIFFDLGDTLLDESAAAEDVIGQYVRNANRLGYPISRDAMCERLSHYFAK